MWQPSYQETGSLVTKTFNADFIKDCIVELSIEKFYVLPKTWHYSYQEYVVIFVKDCSIKLSIDKS
jgi:hypothetical protein